MSGTSCFEIFSPGPLGFPIFYFAVRLHEQVSFSSQTLLQTEARIGNSLCSPQPASRFQWPSFTPSSLWTVTARSSNVQNTPCCWIHPPLLWLWATLSFFPLSTASPDCTKLLPAAQPSDWSATAAARADTPQLLAPAPTADVPLTGRYQSAHNKDSKAILAVVLPGH